MADIIERLSVEAEYNEDKRVYEMVVKSEGNNNDIYTYGDTLEDAMKYAIEAVQLQREDLIGDYIASGRKVRINAECSVNEGDKVTQRTITVVLGKDETENGADIN